MSRPAVVDLDELMRLHAATATPALEQLCWYDVQGEQDSFFTECLEAVPELVRELRLAREDVQAASGELLVEMPRPGTDMARVMLANSAMRRERDQLDEDYRKLFAVKAGLDAENERLKARERELVDAGGNLHFAHPIFGPPHLVAASKRWCELVDRPNGGALQQAETQLRELREAGQRMLRVFDEFADMVVPTPETAVYAPPLGEAADVLRAVLAKVGAQPPERLNHAPNCPAHDGELCDCWKGGA